MILKMIFSRLIKHSGLTHPVFASLDHPLFRYAVKKEKKLQFTSLRHRRREVGQHSVAG